MGEPVLAASPEVFGPIRTESTAILVARKLRSAIEQGHFSGGQQLTEAELARQLGVSRGVLREAMQRLVQEGLLVSRPNRGVFVAEFGPDEVFDIYTARLAVERAACLKVTDTTDRAAELADILDSLTDELEQRAADGADAAELADLDIAFHERMVAEARSPRLSRMYETLATESRMCVSALESVAFAVAERVADHRAIAEAIRAKDVPGLNTLLAEHMDHALEVIQMRLTATGASERR